MVSDRANIACLLFSPIFSGIPSTEMFANNSLFMNDDDEPEVTADDDDDDVIILHIDIREPIKQLRTLLEQRIGINLSRYEFWLQDAQAVSIVAHIKSPKLFYFGTRIVLLL